MARILVVDDEEKIRHLLSIILERKGHKVEQAGDGQEAVKKLLQKGYDLTIADIKMPKMDGHQLLKEMQANENIDCPVIFITAFASVDSAVQAMQDGVIDYISKPFDEERILFTVEKTLNMSRLMDENRELRSEVDKKAAETAIIHNSSKMKKVIELARSVAQENSTVLITGESGTGKELLAKFIHKNSPRAKERFVAVNCAAIPQGLVESELFGHEKGAFTGAQKKSRGKFEYAGKGTLFLDEIGDLPLDAQAKLLRVLQEKSIQRVGSNEEVGVDVRIICATNQDIREKVGKGEFRSDLYYRINVFPLQLPPLRERKEDIAALADFFISKMNKVQEMQLSAKAVEVLKSYPWPGNVRELTNVMERACILARSSGQITQSTLSFLSTSFIEQKNKNNLSLPPEGLDLEEMEMDLVGQALEISGHNQSAAARLLGLTRAKFRILHKQYKKQKQ